MNHQDLARFKKHCKSQGHGQDFDFDLGMDSHGHWVLKIKTKTFQQLQATIIRLADFLTEDTPSPATKLGLAFGAPESR